MLHRSPRFAAVAPLLRQLGGAAALLAALLALLAAGTGIGAVRVTAGAVLGVAAVAVLARAAHRTRTTTFGPAGAVTLARGVLVIGAAALVGRGGTAGVALVVLAGVALLLDAVDGPVARRTGTVSACGARFDMETDAFLLLVLSVHVAVTTGPWWVLAIGLMRYAYAAAGRVLPWLRGELPELRSAKVVAALQGVVLVVVAAGVWPPMVERPAIGVALIALVWSFASSVAWRWRVAPEHPVRWWVAGSGLLTGAGAALVVGVLVLPGVPEGVEPLGFVRLPIEVVAGGVVLAVLPARLRRAVAVAGGAAVAVIGLFKLLDIGFLKALDRPFDPVSDWVLLRNAQEFLQGTVGPTGALVAAAGAVLAALALPVAAAAALLRLGRLAARHRPATLSAAALLGTAWIVLWAGVGGQLVPGAPLAAADGVAQVRDRAADLPAALRDRAAFADEAAVDAYADVPGDRLLGALRGKDVVFTVVESYGRSAVEDPAMAPRIDPVLAEGDDRLGAAGFASRSRFLSSPVTGGGSWLAHATLFSGLRIDDEGRHDQLVSSDRLTLPRAFRDAGWETTAVMPGTTRAWPEASFYGHQRVHASTDDGLGYRGPSFSWSPMPDQYTLSAFNRLEYQRTDRGPLMAEIALTSSHAPWTPVPPTLPWDAIGDGAVYDGHAGGGRSFDSVFGGDPAAVRDDYVHATEYSLRTVLDWVKRFGDDDLVVVVLGDHQPVSVVTGPDGGRDVPISIITRDSAVLDRVAGWGWTPGLKPAPTAQAAPMETFRDRFLATFDR
ncbi:CDP-alcohol phosphatidyltransferase family protein [Pseudonocardia nematodicida]|uniref:CDP-alcohol phosphatidyltransferase family protein n=1 Tax=Pseudonocardia nematodicida TaxID=1206997 RepID=A0ABV1KGQ0_9PSEU